MPTQIQYPQLKDLTWVYQELKTKSMQKLAEEVGCPASCVRWVVKRYFTQEQQSVVKYERKPHTNKKKVKSNDSGVDQNAGT